MNDQRSRIKVIPAQNAAVPFSFCRLAKNSNVFCGPMIIVRPIKKRIYRWGQMRDGKEVVKNWPFTFPIASLQEYLADRSFIKGNYRTYMALSKNIMTPPMRKNPPKYIISLQGDVHCCSFRVCTHHLNKRQPQFLKAQIVSTMFFFLLLYVASRD